MKHWWHQSDVYFFFNYWYKFILCPKKLGVTIQHLSLRRIIPTWDGLNKKWKDFEFEQTKIRSWPIYAFLCLVRKYTRSEEENNFHRAYCSEKVLVLLYCTISSVLLWGNIKEFVFLRHFYHPSTNDESSIPHLEMS